MSFSEKTQLFDAINSGNIKRVNDIIEQITDVNFEDAQGYTPLYKAINSRNANIVRLLINKGADVNKQAKNTLSTPILLASLQGYADVVDALIKAGADVNIPNRDGITPLFNAVKNENEVPEETVKHIVKALLSKGADPYASDSRGKTPIMIAEEENVALVDILKKRGDVGGKRRRTIKKRRTIRKRKSNKSNRRRRL